MEKIVKIVLVSNHILARAGIRSLLDEYKNIYILGETSLVDCIQLLQTCQPDVVIVDIRCYNFPNSSNLVMEILQASHLTHVLIMADSAEDKYILDSFRQGAMGCLLAGSLVDELYQSIICLSTGGSYLPPSIGKKIIQGFNDHTRQQNFGNNYSLSNQQIQVLRFISQGLTNQEIADILNIRKRTVEMHAYNIFKKLKVTNRVQAIHVALSSGLIDSINWLNDLNQVDVQSESIA